MNQPLEFYFDIASPYTYLAATQIDTVGERLGVEIVWRPFLLGAVFQATENRPPALVPHKGVWMLQDLIDWADFYGVRFSLNATFPPNTLNVQRALVAAREEHGHDAMKALALALFHAYWADGLDVTDPETFAQVAESTGLDGEALWARTSDQAIKDRLRADTGEAVERGVFGAPSFFYGDKMWWGNDRLPVLERYISQER